MTKLRSLWNNTFAALLVICISVSLGCASDSAAKKKADDDSPAKKALAEDPLAKQARLLRANSTDETGTGLSEKSRSIENDLGLR